MVHNCQCRDQHRILVNIDDLQWHWQIGGSPEQRKTGEVERPVLVDPGRLCCE